MDLARDYGHLGTEAEGSTQLPRVPCSLVRGNEGGTESQNAVISETCEKMSEASPKKDSRGVFEQLKKLTSKVQTRWGEPYDP